MPNTTLNCDPLPQNQSQVAFFFFSFLRGGGGGGGGESGGGGEGGISGLACIRELCSLLIIFGIPPFFTALSVHRNHIGLLGTGKEERCRVAFLHLHPKSARFSYVTEGALFISAQLSSDAVSALRKVWYQYEYGSNLAPKHARKHQTHRQKRKRKKKRKKKRKRVPSRFKRLWFYLCWCKLCWRL